MAALFYTISQQKIHEFMAAVQLPNNRISSDFFMKVRLLDSGVAVDWSSLHIQQLFMIAESQDYAHDGACVFSIDESDSTYLNVEWPAEVQFYEGIHRLVVQCSLEGDMKTYDKRAVNVVPLSDSAQTVYEDDPTDVEIVISEVNTSIMTEILRACQQATVDANAAAAAATSAATHAPCIINGIWYVWNEAQQQYISTDVPATGDDGVTPHIGVNGNWFIGNIDTGVAAQGPQGLSGNLNWPTFEIDAAMHLQMKTDTASDADHFTIDDEGHLRLII